jgi:hypothetical protein
MSHWGGLGVASGWLAAMRDFHARSGITGLWILHSSFHLLPSSSRGRFAASQAVWGRYGGGMGAMWRRSHEVGLSLYGLATCGAINLALGAPVGRLKAKG